VAEGRPAIEATGTQVAFVHMSETGEAERWFARYGVGDLVRVSDPDKRLYRAFGLEQGSLRELAHPRVWWPWLRSTLVEGHGVGRAGPNWRQLTGVFVIHRGHLLAARRHRNSAARPDYVALVHGLKSKVPRFQGSKVPSAKVPGSRVPGFQSPVSPDDDPS
jgi:hypothetical protein